MPVLQSGLVTPGHACSWVTDGVIQDAGATPAAQRVLASLRGADFNTTGDQPITIPPQFVAFQLTSIVVTGAFGAMSVARGGFYPQAGKAGSPLVFNTQTYAALTTSDVLQQMSLTAFAQNTRFSVTNLGQINGLLNIWFSLSIPQGTVAGADIYLIGIDLT